VNGRSANAENRPSQTARIVALLRNRSPNWVGLPEILELRISQYSARIHQARHEWGVQIENRTETINGKKHSWFRLIEPTPELSRRSDGVTTAKPEVPGSLFGDLAPERYPR
jgi:hypothetical protein